MKYRVMWRYESGIGGPWNGGEIIELTEAEAVALNNDSPGVVECANPKPVSGTFTPATVLEFDASGDESEAEPEADEPEAEEKPEPKKRAVRKARNRIQTKGEDR